MDSLLSWLDGRLLQELVAMIVISSVAASTPSVSPISSSATARKTVVTAPTKRSAVFLYMFSLHFFHDVAASTLWKVVEYGDVLVDTDCLCGCVFFSDILLIYSAV